MNTTRPRSRLPYLPAELLSIIFTLVLTAEESNQSPQALTALKDVCRIWRDVILRNPALWATLNLSYWGECWDDDDGVVFDPSRQLFELAARFIAGPRVHKPTTLIMRVPYNYGLWDTLYAPAAGRPDVFASKFSEGGLVGAGFDVEDTPRGV